MLLLIHRWSLPVWGKFFNPILEWSENIEISKTKSSVPRPLYFIVSKISVDQKSNYFSISLDGYAKLIDEAAAYAKKSAESDKLELACDYLFVSVGMQVLEKIPGRVSVECDARLSYDKEATLVRARRIIRLFKERGIGTRYTQF